MIPSHLLEAAHNLLAITVECRMNPNIFPSNVATTAALSFRKADYDQIREYLNRFNFDEIFSVSDSDDMLYRMFERFVPKSSIKSSRNSCNRQFKKLCAYRKINLNADSSKYEKLCKDFNELKLLEYEKYVHGI